MAEYESLPCKVFTSFMILGTTYDGAGRLVRRLKLTASVGAVSDAQDDTSRLRTRARPELGDHQPTRSGVGAGTAHARGGFHQSGGSGAPRQELRTTGTGSNPMPLPPDCRQRFRTKRQRATSYVVVQMGLKFHSPPLRVCAHHGLDRSRGMQSLQLKLGVGHHGLDDDNSAASGNGRVPAAGEGGHHRIIGDDVVAGDQIEKRLRGDVVQIALAIVVRTSQGNAYLDWPWT